MSFLAGLDLGCVNDPSALVILDKGVEHTRGAAHYRCHLVQRFDLGTPYTEICQRVARLFRQPPLVGKHSLGCLLAVDGTGVGRPVVELLKQQDMEVDLRPVIITGGHQASMTEDRYWHIPKQDLVGVTRVVFQSGRLGMAKDLDGGALLKKELQIFQVKISKAANETYAAREGANDDIVLALAMALWFGENTFTGVWDGSSSVSALGLVDQAYRAYGGEDEDEDERYRLD